MDSIHRTGWDPTRERREEIAAFCAQHQAAAQAFKSVEIPENLTHDWIRVEDQQRIGSCQGHDLTSLGEILHYYNTGGEVVQLSRLHAYIGTQRIDEQAGTQGVYVGGDTGSTIGGGLQYALSGFVDETNCPYRGDAYPSINECRRILAIKQDPRFAVLSGFQVESYLHGLQCLAGGMVLTIGTIWDFLIDPDWIVRQWAPPQRGQGHARVIAEIRNRRLTEINSYSKNWGKNGRFSWEESAFNAMLRHPWTVCLAVTGQAKPKPRRVDFAARLLGGSRI